MKTKNIKKFLCGLTLIVPLLASCSGADAEGSTPDSSEAGTTSETTSVDPVVATKEALTKNVAAMKKYEVSEYAGYKYTRTIGTIKQHSATEITNTFRFDGKNFLLNVKGVETYSTSYADYIAMMGGTMTIEQIKAMFATNSEYVFDDEAETISMSQEEEEKELLYYSETDKQFINYLYDGDTVVNAKYMPTVGNTEVDSYSSLINDVIENGTLSADYKEINYTFVATDLEKDYFNDGGQMQQLAAGFKTAKLTIENNNLKTFEIIFDLDKMQHAGSSMTIDEATIKLSFKDIGNVTLTKPEGAVACKTHVHNGHYIHTETGHREYCDECGKFFGEEVAHVYDETHGICKVCGRINGLTYTADGSVNATYPVYENDYLLGEVGGAKIYAASYMKTAKNEKYIVHTIDSDSNAFSSYDVVYEVDQINIIPELKVAVLEVNGAKTSVADDSCYSFYPKTIKVYKNLEITYDAEHNSATVGDDQLTREYLATLTPDFTIEGFGSLHSSHSEHLGEKQIVHIDDCHDLEHYTCARCGGVVERLLIPSHAHPTYTVVTVAQAEAALGKERFEHYQTGYVIIKETCADDDCEVYYVFVEHATHGGLSGAHAERIFEKQGLRVVSYPGSVNLPHVDNGEGVCAICGDSIA